MSTLFFAFDRSMRSVDADGRLHVRQSNISKATVNPYRGVEIPGWQELGLQPDRVYNMLRHPDELAKGAATFNNIQLLDIHEPVNAEDTRREIVVGCTGSDARFDGTYLVNSLAVWYQDSIDRLNPAHPRYQRELSCSYRYTPDMTPGIFQGLRYDGIMRNIKANHVALVPEGRAGRDVTVNDEVMPVALKSRTAIMLHGALSAALRPLLASDTALDLSAPLENITAANLTAMTPSLTTAILTAATPRLAADKALTAEDVAGVITGVSNIKLAADERDALVDDVDPPARVVQPPVVTPPAIPPVAPVGGVTQAAMDAALRAHENATVTRMNGIFTAMREVEPFVGTVKVAMDSAADVYKLALDHAKVDLTGVDPSAYGALVRMLPVPGTAQRVTPPGIANDSAARKRIEDRFPNRSTLVRGI